MGDGRGYREFSIIAVRLGKQRHFKGTVIPNSVGETDDIPQTAEKRGNGAASRSIDRIVRVLNDHRGAKAASALAALATLTRRSVRTSGKAQSQEFRWGPCRIGGKPTIQTVGVGKPLAKRRKDTCIWTSIWPFSSIADNFQLKWNEKRMIKAAVGVLFAKQAVFTICTWGLKVLMSLAKVGAQIHSIFTAQRQQMKRTHTKRCKTTQ